MQLRTFPDNMSVCQMSSTEYLDLKCDLYFLAHTKDELSLVCRTDDMPSQVINRDDGWRIFCIEGVLDFSLIGILAKIAALLAEYSISIFALSTYNTDYILVKQENYQLALNILTEAGYDIIT